MRFDKKTSGSFLETMPDRHNGQLSSRVVRTGFGLTYGPNRSYSALRIAGRKITFQVAGGLGPDCGCDTPQIPTADRDVSNWSIEKQAYVITPGVYDV
jgi:hypothetical protein